MEMRGGRVAGVTHPSEHVASADLLAGRDRHRAGRQVGEPGVSLGAAEDDVVAENPVQPFGCRAEGDAGLQDEGQFAKGVDSGPLGQAVPSDDDLPVEGRVDGLAPAVALAGRHAEQQGPQAAGGRGVGVRRPHRRHRRLMARRLSRPLGIGSRNGSRRWALSGFCS